MRLCESAGFEDGQRKAATGNLAGSDAPGRLTVMNVCLRVRGERPMSCSIGFGVGDGVVMAV